MPITRLNVSIKKPDLKEKLFEAVKKLGYKSVAEWFVEAAEKAILEAEGKTSDTPTTTERVRLAERIIMLQDKADKLKTKIKNFPLLKQLYQDVGGKLDLSNLEETLPKLYQTYNNPVEVALFEQYARLKKEIAHLQNKLEKETEKIKV